MERGSSRTIILLVSYFLTFSGLVASSSKSSLPFIIYESCMVVLELRESCIFFVTFANCRQRSVHLNTPKGYVAETVFNKTPGQDNRELVHARNNFGSADDQEIVAHMCACNTTAPDIATIKTEFHSEWVRWLLQYVKQFEKLCLLELVGLFKVSNYACRIQQKEVTVNILCQFPAIMTGQSCLRTWTRLRTCNRYETNTNQPQVCLCTLHQNVFSSDVQTNISLPEQLSALSTEKKASNMLSDETDSFEKDSNYNNVLKDGEYLCSNGLDENCTHFANVRSVKLQDCRPGFFGLLCMKRCHCKNNEMCNRNSGACPTDCEIGWKGPTCSKRMCPPGFYGVNLESNSFCGTKCICSIHADCDVLTGECMKSLCLNYTSDSVCAEQVCPRRYIKKRECTTRCHCFNDIVCNPNTGNCPGNLCKAGYSPPNCIEKKTTRLVGAEIVLVSIQLLAALVKLAFLIHLRVLPAVL